MSAVYYCDNCGKKLKKDDHDRVKLRLGKLAVEVMHRLNNTWNDGNICHGCIKYVVASGKKEKP